jgi:hypothetical protein
VRVRLVALGGTVEEVDLVADTGSPFPLIIGLADLHRLRQQPAPDVYANYGLLTGGRIRAVIPAIGFSRIVLGYGSDVAVAITRVSHADFAGLVGLPFLRLMDYGGNADWFWIRPAGAGL